MQNHNIGSTIDLSSYTTDNYYTFPSDGYIWLGYGTTSNINAGVGGSIYSASGNNHTNISCVAVNVYAANQFSQSIYVRKGMRFSNFFNSSSYGAVLFYPFNS